LLDKKNLLTPMKYIITFITAIFAVNTIHANSYKIFKVSEDLQIIKLSQYAYIHISYADTEWGRIASNGLIYIQNHKAFLFDTPMDEPTTRLLVKFIADSLNTQIIGFVPNHWHADCIGGLKYLHSIGVKSYANAMTIEYAQENGYEKPQHAFSDSLVLKLGKKEIVCIYPGAAHSMDNIVVWLPGENLLFGGCMVKDLNAKNMGNYADGDLKQWPETINRVMNRFPAAKIVIPGHGQFGGFDMLKHTHELAKAHAN
jgi:metallo-beta-lactamase class B